MVAKELGTLNQDLIVFVLEVLNQILTEEGIMDLCLLLLDVEAHCYGLHSGVDLLNVTHDTKLICVKTDSLLTLLELTFWVFGGAD